MDFSNRDFSATAGTDAILLQKLLEKMNTDFFTNDMPSLEGGGGGCNCPPPPPDLHWRPPPDPTDFFKDLFEDAEFLELKQQCEMDIPSMIPVDLLPKHFQPLPSQYLVFLISVILVMFFVLIGATFCLIYLRRTGKCRRLLNPFDAGKEQTSQIDRNSAEESTAVIGLANGQRRRSDNTAHSGSRAPTVRGTEWSYNSMRPPAQGLTAAEFSNLHQTSSLGLLMYGEHGPSGVGNLPYSHSSPANHESRLYTSSSQTINKPKNGNGGTKILPSAAYFKPIRTSIANRPAPPGVVLQKDPKLTTALLASRREVDNRTPVYEEIPAPNGGETSFFLPPQNSSRNSENCPRRLAGRLPPPRSKPPPPPDLESPCSSQSCSCSVGSTSLDQELLIDGCIQITPSPRRKTVPGCSSGEPAAMVHNSNISKDKSTQSEDSAFTPTTNGTATTSSPQDTTVSDCGCACECSINGRESGYGTEGRQKSRQKWNSPKVSHRQSKGPLNNYLKSPTKQLWVSVQSPENKMSNGSRSDNFYRDSNSTEVVDPMAALTIYKQGDSSRTHSTHSMTYV